MFYVEVHSTVLFFSDKKIQFSLNQEVFSDTRQLLLSGKY